MPRSASTIIARKSSEAGLKTTAVRAGDDWVINGVKDAVANAPLAKLFAVAGDAARAA